MAGFIAFIMGRMRGIGKGTGFVRSIVVKGLLDSQRRMWQRLAPFVILLLYPALIPAQINLQWVGEQIDDISGVPSIASLWIDDADHDGLNDILATTASGNSGLILLYKRENDTWTRHTIDTVSNKRPFIRDVGDADNDGNNEVLVDLNVDPVFGNKQAELRLYKFKAGVWSYQTIIAGSSGSYAGVIGDANGNEKNDIVVGGYDFGKIALFEHDSGNFVQRQIDTTNQIAVVLAIGDAINLGKPQVYIGTHTSGHIYAYQWNGSAWVKTTVEESTGDIACPRIGDADNDGNNDLLVDKFGGPWGLGFYQYSGGAWSRTVLESEVRYGPTIIIDLDGDGQKEVVSHSEQEVYAYQYNASSGWTRSTIIHSVDLDFTINGSRFYAGDALNNGRQSIVVGQFDGGKIWLFSQPPAISLSATTVNAGTVTKGSSDTATFRVRNTGGGTLSVSGIASSNSQFTVSPASLNVAAGDSQTVTVTFAPTKVGWEQSTLTITHNATGSPSTVTANGIGRIQPPTGSLVDTRIAFSSSRDGNNEIYAMGSDGAGQVRLTSNSVDDEYPSWSPDGTQVVFASKRDGNEEIYVMGSDGSNPTRLTNNPAQDNGPRWSPDGTRIVFHRGNNIYVMNSDGTEETLLPTTGVIPSWSPDGSKIVFHSSRDGQDEIYVINADGTGEIRLTDNSAADNGGVWSPDGTQIAFRSSRDGDSAIYVMNADGTVQTRLSNSPGSDQSPCWSPDGTKIVFASERDGNWEIYTMNADGSGQTRLTDVSGYNLAPFWSPFLPTPSISLSATSLSFGNVNVGASGQQTLTVSNTGTATLDVTSITLSGTDAGAFSVSPASFTVEAGQSQAVAITFSPASGGAKSASLSIAHNVSGSPTTVSLSGTGVPPDPSHEYTSDANTVALWHFNDGSGSTASDASSSENNGTVTDATWTQGLFGQALSFDGEGDGVQVGNPFNGIQSAFTIEAWFKTLPATGSHTAVIFKKRAEANDIMLHIPPDPKTLVVDIYEAGGTQHQYITTKILPPEIWYHVAVTYDKSHFRIYLNGNLELEEAATYDVDWSTSYIGTAIGDCPNAGQGFDGIIDEVRISNTARAYTPFPVSAFSTESLAFGNVSAGSSGQQTLTVSNTGSATLNVTGITISGTSAAEFSVSPASFSVDAGQNQAVTVTFTPASEGGRSASLSIAHNASGSPMSVSLSGTGMPALAPDLQIVSKIAFTTDRDGNREIYVMNADGTGQTPLTNNGANDRDPAWSPDGTKIAFNSLRDGAWEVYMINADGANPVNLTDNAAIDLDPLWSPDGTKIAFSSGRDGGAYEIYVMNADGTGQARLTNNSASDIAASWSPDGTRIVFYSERDGNREIYVMDADGANPLNLTNNPATDSAPYWSPDGTKIAFHSDRDHPDQEIYVMDADGTNQIRLTNNSGTDYVASWSPDCTRIVFGSGRDGNIEIYVMDANGANPTRLTTNAATDEVPHWMPFQLIGSTNLGTPVSRTMTIENKGDATLTVSNITSSDGQFTISPTSFSVNADASQDVTVTFTPTSAGTNYVTLTITSNDPDAGTINLTANGTGQELPPAISLSATAVNAGIVNKGASGTASFTVTNVGGGTLSVSNITSGNSQFTVSPTGFDLSAGASQTVTVTFSPTVVGWEQSTLTITHNASGNPFAVTANGIGRVTPPTGDLTNTKIVFETLRDYANLYEIYVMNADGTNQTRLTNNTVNDYNRSWSPDGTKLPFTSVRDGQYEVYVMNADGTSQTRVTNNPARDAAPVWSPDGTKTVFTSDRDGNIEIYVMNADGSNQTRLTNHSAYDDWPSWSPDGTKIVFHSEHDGNKEVYVMNADGTNQTRLTNHSAHDAWPSWSPDGTKIAFLSQRDGNNEVYVMNADGTNQVNLTNNSGTSDGNPSWSPDGTKIAFDSDRSGKNQLYVMNADGTNQTRITSNSSVDTNPSWSPFLATTPTISLSAISLPIGNVNVGDSGLQILTVTNTGTATLDVTGITLSGTDAGEFAVSPTIFAVAAGQSQDITVALSPTSTGAKSASLLIAHNASGSPSSVALSGTGILLPAPDLQIAGKIAFYSTRDGNYEIYVMDADGSGVTRLTDDPAQDLLPTWSPDGMRIAFRSARDGDQEIYAVNVDGSGLTQLTENAVYDGKASWSPDGSKLVFFSERDGNREIYVMNADGTDVIRLIDNSAGDWTPTWSPDGTKIAFQSDRSDIWEIYVMNVDGSEQIQLSRGQNPSWSPDGSKIAFDSAHEIYIINSDGTNQIRLTNDTFDDREPSWSPDGSKIVFRSSRDGNPQLYVINVDGSDVVPLTNNTAEEGGPSWSVPHRIGFTNIGSSVSRTMTIENKGDATLTVSSITSSDEQFTISPTSFSVNAGASQDVTATFTPASAETQYATLAITSNDPDAGTVKLTVNGTGTQPPTPEISLSATSLSAGSVNAGASGTATFTVGNTGNAALNITGITVTGTDASQFTVSPATFTVNVGTAAQTVTVTFEPASAGTKSASLSIAHNASGSPSTVTLSGTGVGVPAISLSATSLAVDNTNVGGSSQKTFTINNTGTGSLSVTSIAVSGTDASQFTV